MNRNRLWRMALEQLKLSKAAGEEYRRKAAWTYLQMAMRKPANTWTDTPPRVTVGGAA